MLATHPSSLSALTPTCRCLPLLLRVRRCSTNPTDCPIPDPTLIPHLVRAMASPPRPRPRRLRPPSVPFPSSFLFLLLFILLSPVFADNPSSPPPPTSSSPSLPSDDPAQHLLSSLQTTDLNTVMESLFHSGSPSSYADEILRDAQNLVAQRQTAEALRFLRLAAILGHPGAHATAGSLLLAGEGTATRDISAAVRHLRAAASRSQPEALALLGFLHASGIADRHGVPKSLPAALLRWTFAAAAGNVYASAALGFRYLYGFGLPRSCQTAARFYQKAATAIATDPRHWPSEHAFLDGKPPLPSSLMDTGRTRLDENILRSKPPPLSSDDADLVAYYRHSAERGDVRVMTMLGALHFFGGYGLEPNENAARELLQRAADAQGGEAHGILGHLALRERNNSTAIIHFRHSAATGSKIGHYALGMTFYHGLLGMEQDFSKAAMHFTLATEEGHADASFHLGLLYWHGKGVEKSIEKAFHHFQQGARLGSIQCKLNVGTILLEGTAPVRKANCELAVKYLKDVAEQGEWRTVFHLAVTALDNDEWYTTLHRHMQAAYAGIEIAQHNAAMLLEIVDKDKFPELQHWDRDRFIREAQELYDYSGSQGYTESLIRSGNIEYLEREDFAAAARIYGKAAHMNNTEGMVSLGLMHASGLGVPEDREQALRYLERASNTQPEAEAPAIIAKIGLRCLWYLSDTVKRITAAILSLEETQSVEINRIIERISLASESMRGTRSVIGATKTLDIVEELVFVGALLAVLLAVLVVRSKRLARLQAEEQEQQSQ